MLVFTFRVPCCDVRYDFRIIETMLGSSLLPVVCRRAHVLFTLFVYCLRIVVSNTYCFVFLFCFLCVVYPILPVSMDCFCFVFPCFEHPMLPVSLDCFCFVFLRLVYPMLPVSLDCSFVIANRYSLTFS